MNSLLSLLAVVSVLTLSACSESPPETANEPDKPVADEHQAEPDHAILWAHYSAEYQAVSAQIYAQATRDLPRLLADDAYSAVPGVEVNVELPPAVILDIDETVMSGTDMEMTLVPFSTQRQYEWGLDHPARAVRGVVSFIDAARALDIEVFFVTNRPCQEYDGADGGCPIEPGTIADLAEIGIETDAEHMLFANEMDGWDREKVSRREYLAKTHRILMLIGDDYADFVACARPAPKSPCTEAGTRASRHAALDTYNHYWGNGWYILPNPMYGSWTSAE